MGIIVCEAKNHFGTSEVRANVVINDLNEEFSVWTDNAIPIVVGDKVSVACGVSSHKYSDELKWFKGDVAVENGNGESMISYHLLVYRQNCSNKLGVKQFAFRT